MKRMNFYQSVNMARSATLRLAPLMARGSEMNLTLNDLVYLSNYVLIQIEGLLGSDLSLHLDSTVAETTSKVEVGVLASTRTLDF